MNDEAAQSRGPSGPSHDVPAASVPAENIAEAPAAAETAPPAQAPQPAEPPTTEVPAAQTPPAEPPTAQIPPAEAPTDQIPPAEPPTAHIPPAAAPSAEVPPAWAPPVDGEPEADEPPVAAAGASGADGPPTPGGTMPPPGGTMPPPWWAGPGGPTFSRAQLVRPREGRYVAGVCAALARATNTDPILWRVLVTVLGVLSGVGILLYLIGWLIIPAEGDTASPIESLLGKGRSGMAPLSVVLLGGAAVLSFAFIVHDGMRASILAAAVIVGAALLIKRGGPAASRQASAASAASDAFPPGQFPPGPFPPGSVPPGSVPPPGAGEMGAGFGATATEPVTAPLPPQPPGAAPAPPFAPPGGYRPPFAPHGPYAPSGYEAYPPPAPPRPPKPPRPPRERSKLGRLTFFAVALVIGVLAVLDMAGAHIAVAAYFAAALATIAAGLIVGAWFGRARGLIALALLTTLGLAVSTGTERFGGDVGNSVYRPASLAAVADRYDFTAGSATLDLRGVDFTGQQQEITTTMKLGQLKVLLPKNVDTTAAIRLQTGRAMLFGKEFDNRTIDGQTVTDLGADGAGGGTLRLNLELTTGNLEVNR